MVLRRPAGHGLAEDRAAIGHHSLREITREQVLNALPPSGSARSTAGQGLKSSCRLLKGRKVLFTEPSSTRPTPPAATSAASPTCSA